MVFDAVAIERVGIATSEASMRACVGRGQLISLLAGVLALGLGLGAGRVNATSASTDQSDLWWNSAESGWGIQLVQQHDTIFATMYVYAASGQPEFYVAVLERSAGLTWSGKTYRATGPYWGGAFVPAAVVETEVGTMAFTASTVSSGQLDYTIGGTSVSKVVERMSFANDHLAPSFTGTVREAMLSGPCTPLSAAAVTAQFTHAGGSPVAVSLVFPSRTCTIATGSYSQRGQFGRIGGAYTCTDGESGTSSLTELRLTVETLTFRYGLNGNGPSGACQIDGDFAGLRW